MVHRHAGNAAAGGGDVFEAARARNRIFGDIDAKLLPHHGLRAAAHFEAVAVGVGVGAIEIGALASGEVKNEGARHGDGPDDVEGASAGYSDFSGEGNAIGRGGQYIEGRLLVGHVASDGGVFNFVLVFFFATSCQYKNQQYAEDGGQSQGGD